MKKNRKNNGCDAAFREVLIFIDKELGSDNVDKYLECIRFGVENNQLMLSARPNQEKMIQQRLVPGIEAVFHKHEISGTVKVVPSKDEATLAEQIRKVLGDDFELLGIVPMHEDGTFIVLKTAIREGDDKNSILILEVDDTEPVSKHSFSVVQDCMILKVFKLFCENCKLNDDE